jgi:hypothetical protein
MTHQPSICAFWLWPGGKLSDHQAVGLRPSQPLCRYFRLDRRSPLHPIVPQHQTNSLAVTERTACLAVLYSAGELIGVRSLQRKPLAGLYKR